MRARYTKFALIRLEHTASSRARASSSPASSPSHRAAASTTAIRWTGDIWLSRSRSKVERAAIVSDVRGGAYFECPGQCPFGRFRGTKSGEDQGDAAPVLQDVREHVRPLGGHAQHDCGFSSAGLRVGDGAAVGLNDLPVIQFGPEAS